MNITSQINRREWSFHCRVVLKWNIDEMCFQDSAAFVAEQETELDPRLYDFPLLLQVKYHTNVATVQTLNQWCTRAQLGRSNPWGTTVLPHGSHSNCPFNQKHLTAAGFDFACRFASKRPNRTSQKSRRCALLREMCEITLDDWIRWTLY
jgi:hypothetical protein